MKLGILFDLDGTLLDTLGDLTDSINYAMRHHGYPERTMAWVRSSVGSGVRNLVRLCLDGDDHHPDLEQVLATYLQYYALHNQDKTCPYPGIPEALARLQQHLPLAIVSNKQDDAVKSLCATHFPGIFALGETPDCPRKPAPDMVKKAMAAIGVDTCIYVGDSDVDVITANNAGVPCLSVLWGFRDRPCIEAVGGKHFCDDPGKLADTLLQMVKESE